MIPIWPVGTLVRILDIVKNHWSDPCSGSCAKSGEWKQAIALLQELSLLCRDCDGCQLSWCDTAGGIWEFGNQRGVFQFVHEEFVSIGQFSAIQLWNSMKVLSSDDHLSWTTSWFAGFCPFCRRPETSGVVLPRLEVKNLEVDVVPFSAAINACAKGQEWLPALLLLSELNTVSCGICHVNTQKR